jgi:D-tagatose-1,6-bisphosphate aldolase subunit GatZ/KbaZ
MVFEAHSTDYQTGAALKALVEDHFAILKVGPGVTFALREALWALSDVAMELDLMPESSGSLKDVVLEAMQREPRYWQAYYLDAEHRHFDLQFSLSDRIRYYWAVPEVAHACARLLELLTAKGVPLTLLSQYLPRQYAAIREGRLRNDPHALLLDSVAHPLRQYAEACRPASRAAND